MYLATCSIVLVLAAADPCPVPYSQSDSDGMPYESDWKLFDALHQQVRNDSGMQQQRADLIRYATDRVRTALPDLRGNLQNMKVLGFDMVWPGDGFNGVAYGGLYEVLVQLEQAGVSQVGKRMGASGGACSAILTMANSDTLLKLYQVYQLYYQNHPERVIEEGLRDTGVTAAIYAEAARDPDVFARAQKDALIVSKCSSGGNTIFRGFQTLKQFVAAGYSSGDASLGGATIGTKVEATNVGHCGDGGGVTVFPAEVAGKNFGVLKYDTPWVSTSSPTAASIDKLFRAGVDNAIAALKSKDLSASEAGGKIYGVLPGPDGIVTATEYAAHIGHVTQTQDVNLAKATIVV